MYNLESDPGEFNRKVVFEYLEITRVREEPVRSYAEWKTKWVSIEEQSGDYTDTGGAMTANATVQVTMYFDAEIADITIKNRETMRFRHVQQVPVYMTTLDGDILLNLKGFPMVQEVQENVQYYYVTQVNEFDTMNRRMILTAERTR